MHAFEVESISEENGDAVLDIKILPDRAPYALCHLGIAREISAITGTPYQREAAPEILITDEIETPEITIDSELVNRYMLQEVRFDSCPKTPNEIKESLKIIGQRSINGVVDILNYLMFDIGQPLHAFDADKLVGSITIRTAKNAEKITLLDGREVTLSEEDLVVADEEGVLAIAGVKGGKRAEVTESTKRILIESANFHPTAVRRTANRLSLRTDASKRFENAISPELCGDAIRRATAHIVEISSGRAGGIADEYPKPPKQNKVQVSGSFICSLIGHDIPDKEILSILGRMDCQVEVQGGTFVIVPPIDRLDISIPEDVADEVARIFGYDKIPSKMPSVLHQNVPLDKNFYWIQKIKNILQREGFSEIKTYTLVPDGHLKVKLPLASDKAALREKIEPKLREALAFNLKNKDILELDEINLFEIGKVFPKGAEATSLCLGTTGKKLEKTIAVLEDELGVSLKMKISGGVAECNLDKVIDTLPEAESIEKLNFEKLPDDLTYKPFSLYPYIVRDIAVWIPESDQPDELIRIIEKYGGGLLVRKPRHIDTYKKDNRTSYAYRFVFQSPERTLIDSEVNEIMKKITDEVNAKAGWEVR